MLAVSGTWISNPVTYLPLYWFNYQVGSELLGHEKNIHYLSQFGLQEISSQGWIFCSRLLLGSAVTGAFWGLSIGLLTYIVLRLKTRKLDF